MAWSPPAHRATLVGLKQVGLPLGGMLGRRAPAGAIASRSAGARRSCASAALIAAGAIASLLVYRDPPDARGAGGGAGRTGHGDLGADEPRSLAPLDRHRRLRGDADRVDVVPRAVSAGRRRAHAAGGQPVSRPRPVRRHGRARRSSECCPIACSADDAGCRWSWPGVGSTACTLIIRRPAPEHRRRPCAPSPSSSASSGSAGTASSTPGWPSWPGLGRPAPRSASAWRSPRQA